ncbi:hypothetical protein [Streptomyces sp. 1331.2]|uniref:hypothetical protein n=1 Tax=Streptomyces sp. 1331.2 TaxID=1938835 RepID=UPI000BCF3BEC|nr:hypothetical protein [Streptomyces sp. 1331.2]SOB85308.1 hypothetical protein SAMN06272789_5591 [Streptomyces sp. 1331.2]
MRPAPDGGKTPGAVRAARRAVGDPRLVRAGQGLVPTPRAVELREEVGELLRGCENVLRPGAGFDPVHLERTFTVQTSDVVPARVAGPLTERIRAQAPKVDVLFLPEALEGGPAQAIVGSASTWRRPSGRRGASSPWARRRNSTGRGTDPTVLTAPGG